MLRTLTYFTYGFANGNAWEARRLYQEGYPNRMVQTGFSTDKIDSSEIWVAYSIEQNIRM